MTSATASVSIHLFDTQDTSAQGRDGGGIAKCEHKRTELIDWALDAAIAATLPREVLHAKARALAVEIAGYEVELVNLERQLMILTSGAPDEEALKRLCAELAKGMDIFEPADRPGVIELLDVRATAYRGITVAEDKIVLSGLIPTFSISTDGEYVKLDPVETPSESET